MPLYSISRAHAREEIDKLEQKGEEVTAIAPDGATLLVTTRKTGRFSTEVETR
jgi:hypothetical protein